MPREPVNAESRNLSSKIARNSLWYGIEVGASLLATLLIAIIVARAIGPQRLGYFNYIYWLSNTAGGLGSLGIPAATSKYMAEYLASGQKNMARAIFSFTLRMQTGLALLLTATGLVLVFTIVDPAYRNIAVLLVATMIPRMVTFIPSAANVGMEDVAINTRAAVTGSGVYVALVVLSLTLHWDLIGIAAAVLVSSCTELSMKLIPVLGWICALPPGELPPHVRTRMISFSRQNLVLMLLNVVVWDRSDIIFLKVLQPDTRQLAFFSVAFSIIEKLFLIPQSFSAGVGVSQLAEYGRDRKRLLRMTTTAAKYVYLCGLPLLAGAAAISGPLIRATYGIQYAPMVSVFQLMALFAIPRIIQLPAYNLLLATENQKALVVWNCVCGAINVLLDVLLIPSHAAVGAAIGNGVAQALASIGIWIYVSRHFSLKLDLAFFLKLTLVSACMAAVVMFIASRLPAW